MSLEAFPFVNWIFWMTLSAGSLLVVGVTERIGGTTRGYRLFMAGLLTAFALVLLASELALPSGTAADPTADLRRWLSLAFVAGCVAYLVATVARWPRSGLAMLTGGVGLAALATLALAGGTRSPLLFAGQLVLSALSLGAVAAGMLLGHWYLVTPQLSPTPLRRMIAASCVALVAQAALFGLALLAVGREPIHEPLAWLTWLRLGVGLLAPVGIGVLALLASRAASLQATTGLLYIGLALVMAGSIAGASLSYISGVPV